MKRWLALGAALGLGTSILFPASRSWAQHATRISGSESVRTGETDRARALQEENQTLRAAAEAAERKLQRYEQAAAQLVAQAEARSDQLARSNAILREQVQHLERRLAALSASPTSQTNGAAPEEAAAPETAQGTRAPAARDLAQERDDLERELRMTLQRLAEQTILAERAAAQVKPLQARLAVLEAQAVPYTDEERALLAAGRAAATRPESAAPPAPEVVTAPPPGAEKLVAEALRGFRQNRLDAAAAKLREVLQLAPTNVFTLANLATVEYARGQLDEAEQHIQRAIRLAPRDAFSLILLGKVKLAREQYDAALEALSQAAELEPQNAEAQNLLGIVLSEKGLRGPAETALRRAVQLEPGYGEAHNNLAFVYLLQNPPAAELARWHYLKAREAGHPRNAALEEKLKAAGAPVSP